MGRAHREVLLRRGWADWAASSAARPTASAFWVGLDGYSSTSVEQLGTDSDCVSGKPSYYAWYEMYPNPSVRAPERRTS